MCSGRSPCPIFLLGSRSLPPAPAPSPVLDPPRAPSRKSRRPKRNRPDPDTPARARDTRLHSRGPIRPSVSTPRALRGSALHRGNQPKLVMIERVVAHPLERRFHALDRWRELAALGPHFRQVEMGLGNVRFIGNGGEQTV